MLLNLEIRVADMVYVRDKERRDMVLTTGLGIYSTHYSEKKNFSHDKCPVKLNILEKVQHILSC